MNQLKERPFYTRVALTGVGMVLSLAALLFVAIVIFSPSDIVFPIVIAVIALVVGSVIYFVQPWGLILGLLGGLFALLVSTDGIDLSLGTPQSFFDFIFPIVLLPAGVLLLVGSITGLVQHFQHKVSEGNQTVSMAIKGVVGVMGVLLVISAALTVANMGDVSAADKEGAALLTAKDSKFEQEELSTSASGKVVIKNDDMILHTFTIDALDLDIKVGPKSEELYTLEGVKPGDYFYRCRVSGHESMDGKLTVK